MSWITNPLRRRPGGASAPVVTRRHLGALAGALAALAIIAFVPGAQPHAGADATTSQAGSQGTDTSLPATSSAVTVSGRNQFQNLKITVNQTTNLVNQAISVSWTGGTPTYSNPTTLAFQSTFNGDYLQIFQCWGDPQSTDPLTAINPGPTPAQCEFGGESSTPTTSYPIQDLGSEYSRVLAQPSWSTYDASQSSVCGQTPDWLDTSTNYVVEPFEEVDGTRVCQQANYNAGNDPNNPQDFWLNSSFSFATTNEIDFARTYADGTGQQLFQADTGLEAPGLGCGQQIQPVAGGGTKAPQCWLVVVPRGGPADENPPGLTGVNSVVTSPLTPQAWANRIAIPLQFNPVGTDCSSSANAQDIVGSELASSAFSSWAPALCVQPGSTPYSYIQATDDQGRKNLVSPSYGAAGLSVFSDPIDPSETGATNPVVYAPLTLSGVVVGFNIERTPALDSNGQPRQDEVGLSGSRVEHLNLTPRLVAKLLTESYRAQLEGVTGTKQAGYGWIQNNPISLFSDPDFLQYNREFPLLSTQQQIDAGTLVVEESSSDAATALWKWVLADPEARAWLNGTPTPDGTGPGMNVNPNYSINAKLNPSHVSFGSSTPNDFPKSDRYLYDTKTLVGSGSSQAPARPIGVLDWSPYALNMRATALAAATANDGAKTTPDITATPNTAWTSNGPQKTGTYFVMSVTDSASAARYGLQTADLSRAGDDSSSRTFVAPDANGILAGEAAMTPSSVTGVLQTNPSTTRGGAYPLTMLTYAATRPETLTSGARQSYSAFVLYSLGDGQTPGVEPGQLPAGYVPLPGALRLQALQAARTILNPPAIPSAATTPSKGSSAGGTSGSSGGLSAFGASTSMPSSIGASGFTTTGGTAAASSAGPVRAIGASALTVVDTKGITVGMLRWVLPIGLLIGLAAAIGATLLGRTGRRPALVTSTDHVVSAAGGSS